MKCSEEIVLKLYKTRYKISYYSQMLFFSQCLSEISFYTDLIEKEVNELKKIEKSYKDSFKALKNNKLDYNNLSYYPKGKRNIKENNMKRQREFTLDELKKYDGSNGNPAYVAINGIVYDVSYEPTWGGGTHFGLYSGKDLSNEFLGCHKGMVEILNKLPKVGIIK